MTEAQKSAILAAKRLCDQTWKLIQDLEAQGFPPDHEVFDILEERLFERTERYNALLDAEIANRAEALIFEVCKN